MHPVDRARTGRRLAVLAPQLAGLVALTAGCGSAIAPVSLPAKSAVRPAVLTAPVLTSRQQVIDTYLASGSAQIAASQTRSAAAARAILTRYLPARAVTIALASFETFWRRHQVLYGSRMVRVIGVQVRGQRAWIHTCTNLADLAWRNVVTGQLTPIAAILPEDQVTIMDRTARGWLQGTSTKLGTPCAA